MSATISSIVPRSRHGWPTICPTYGQNFTPVPARISCTGSISVPPIRWSGRISAAARADSSVASSVSDTTSIQVSWPFERMSSISAASSSFGRPTSLQPTCRRPLPATDA